MIQKAEAVIRAYTATRYGELVKHAAPIFDETSKIWTAELESTYPRIINDDAEPEARVVRYMTIGNIGVIRLDESLNVIEATPEVEVNETLVLRLSAWRQLAEKVIVDASSKELAQVGQLKEHLSPIVRIVTRLLRADGLIPNEEIAEESRSKRMKQYLNLLEQSELVRRVDEGYAAGNLLIALRKESNDKKECMTNVLASVLKYNYSTLRQVFDIRTFEPYIHADNCYYSPAIQAGHLLHRSEDSLIRQYVKWYGQRSKMSLIQILDELADVQALEKDGNYFVGREDLFKEMLASQQSLMSVGSNPLG